MHRHPDYTRTRIAQLCERIQTKIYSQTKAVDDLQVSTQVERIPYAEAQALTYRPVKLGEQFGPQWATYWFKAKVQVPRDWQHQRVDLNWVSHSEATLWLDGRTAQGLNFEPSSWDRSVRSDAVLLERAAGGETLEFQIEMACNRVFGDGNAGFFKTYSPFMLDACETRVFDPLAWEIYYDFMVLQELEKEQDGTGDLDKTWGGELLYELNRFANFFNEDDRGTWAEAHAILKPLYSRKNASRVHELSAIGHAHIDTAWLWPLAETWRKCERTFSSQTAYMEKYPEYLFACSQAYQYAIVKSRNPDLYQRIRAKVKSGQFVPVGGTWIEPDCNIPSGEALCRQFLHGQKYFEKEFGMRCKEFWNPDVFGYNGQLPQIMRQSGIARFLTQKLSWNRFNKPHFHTFVWQGIDGSEVIAHFPPADTYNANASVKQLRENARNYKDHDRSRHSLMLFGYGDGGGGPTKHMLEILRRAKDLQGLPRTQIRTSDAFFSQLEQDAVDLPTMVGELYFEYHRGTYTTQASTKKNNRKNEFLLHDVEFLAACAHKLNGAAYPSAELDRIWKLLLLNQFHDILPGSSITLVYDDAERDHGEIRASGEKLRDAALAGLSSGSADAPVNTIGFERNEVVSTRDGSLAFVKAPSYGIGVVVAATDSVKATKQPNGTIVLENEHLKAELSPGGDVTSLIEKHLQRETLSKPGNAMLLFHDRPTAFDAWDVDPFHLETEKACPPAHSCALVSTNPLRAEVAFERKIGVKSSMKQTVRLDAHARRLEFHTTVDWQESNMMLKVAFPINARAMNATYEMQFGTVERPTHFNTMYDLARFEVPGHKWADLSERGFGAALLTDSKYGYSTYKNRMCISLLRSPKGPDPKADMGQQTFAYAIYPHAGDWRDGRVVAEAFRFNVPMQWTKGGTAPKSFFSVADDNLVLDTVKRAEESDAIVLRFYETHGARGTAKVNVALPFKRAVLCNVLEEEGRAVTAANGVLEIPYTPYQIIGVKLS